MSLNDRYHREDSRLARIDSSLTRLGDRAGNVWLDHTGIDRSILTYSLYLLAAGVAFQKLVLFHDAFDTLIILMAVMGMLGLSRTRGGIVEQLQVEAMGLPKNTLVFFRLLLLLSGIMGLSSGLGYIVESIQTGAAFPPTGIESLLSGLMLTVLQCAEYIQRTNPTPPSRGFLQRAPGNIS